jgi:hypothetical protein
MRLATWFVASLIVALAGCQARSTEQPPAPFAATDTPTASLGGASDAQEALDRLDTRVPVPLLPMMAIHQKQNMRDHLLAVQEIVVALATDDFAAIERSAGRIGFSEQMGRMCSHMGAGAPGFTEQALAFHHTADTIAAAAGRRDRVAVTQALGTTLQTCTGCHAVFRQSVVDDATWQRLTSTPAPTEHSQPEVESN